MRILVACEYSGVVRDAFRAKGHDAISCDLLPTDVAGPHLQCSVSDVINDNWDMLIAHPPCTYLTNSGVRWLHERAGRWEQMRDGAEFFRSLWNAPIPKIVVENPIMHKYAREIIGDKYTQIVQPWMFGHAESKATCLWIKGLPPLMETDNVKEQWRKLPKKEAQRLHMLPPSPDRWKLRSQTYTGIATAMSEQWG